MTPNLSRVFYFPLDRKNEEQEPIEIALSPDESADLSALPEDVRTGFLVFGAPEEGSRETVFPKEGVRFLAALLASANAYLRVRETAERLATITE